MSNNPHLVNHLEADIRIRELIRQADLPEPEVVHYHEHEVVVLWPSHMVALVIDLTR